MAVRTRLEKIGPCLVHLREARWEQDLAIAREVIERDCYRLRRIRRSGVNFDSILDIGGHIGCFGLWAKHFWPDARLLAVEPNQESAELYEQNLKANALNNAQVVQAALSYSKERLVLLEGAHSTGGAVVKAAASGAAIAACSNPGQESYQIAPQAVKALTLEELLQASKIERVGLAKFDCEGAELEIFEHMSAQSARSLGGCVIGEYHIDGGFEAFRKVFRNRLPELKLYGLNFDGAAVAPFFAAAPGKLSRLFGAISLYNRIRAGGRSLFRLIG